MTSRKSFWKQCKIDLKKQMPMFGINLAAYLLMLVFVVGAEISNFKMQILNDLDEVTYREQTIEELLQTLSGISSIILVTAVLLGFAAALQAYAWINKANQVDFYYSQPVKRSHRFWGLNISNVLLFLGGLTVAEIFANIVIAIGGFWTVKMIGASLLGIGLSTLCYLSAFAITLIAVLLTGNGLLAFLGGGFLISLEYLVQIIYQMYMNSFFTSYYTEFRNQDTLRFCFGPLMSIAQINVGAGVWRPHAYILESLGGIYVATLVKTVLMLMAQCVVYFAIAYFIFKKRPAMNGEKQMIFPMVNPFIKSIIMIVGSLWLGWMFSLTLRKSFGLWGVIIGLLVIQVVVQSLMEGHIKACAKGWISFLISSAIAFGIFCSFLFDWYGFDSFVPKAEDIDCFAVETWDGDLSHMRLGDDGNYHYLEELEKREIRDRECINAMCAMLTEMAEKNHGKVSLDNETSNYDAVMVHAKYVMKDGKTKYRSYQLPYEILYSLKYALNNNEEYRLSEKPISLKGIQSIYNRKGDVIVDYTNQSLTEQNYQTKKKEEILKIADLLEQAYINREPNLEMTEAPIGYVTFQTSEEEDFYDAIKMEVYACDKEVIAYLEKMKWIESTDIVLDDIKSVEVTKYYDGKDESYGVSKEWTIDEPMAQDVLENCVVCREGINMSRAVGYVDSNYVVVINMTNGNTYSAYLYKNQVPKELENELMDGKQKIQE